MLSIRLSKIGKTNRPAYRVVVVNKRSGRDGRPLEILGNFDPFQKTPPSIKTTRLDYWISQGAHLTTAVQKIIDQNYQFKPYSGSKAETK